MTLICCVMPEEGCICAVDAVCGGVHHFEKGCPTHLPAARSGPVQWATSVHNLGEKPVETI